MTFERSKILRLVWEMVFETKGLLKTEENYKRTTDLTD